MAIILKVFGKCSRNIVRNFIVVANIPFTKSRVQHNTYCVYILKEGFVKNKLKNINIFEFTATVSQSRFSGPIRKAH